MKRNPKPLLIAASLLTVVCAEPFLLAREGAQAGVRLKPKSGSWRFGIGVEVACGMVDGIKSLV